MFINFYFVKITYTVFKNFQAVEKTLIFLTDLVLKYFKTLNIFWKLHKISIKTIFDIQVYYLICFFVNLKNWDFGFWNKTNLI